VRVDADVRVQVKVSAEVPVKPKVKVKVDLAEMLRAGDRQRPAGRGGARRPAT
jgi:hypothetical protein